MIVLTTLTIAMIIGWMATASNRDFVEVVGFVILLLSGLMLAIALTSLPVSHYNGKAEVERYHALKETINESRKSNISEVERAAILTEISDYNKDLASVKYWNNTIFDWWIYDGLAELDYLE